MGYDWQQTLQILVVIKQKLIQGRRVEDRSFH